MARVYVSVGAESGEGVSSTRTYPLGDLSVLQLAYVLDDVVDELVARGVWSGPRPTLRLEPMLSRAIGRMARAGSSSRIPSVSHE
jgi:hypothetical protein